MRTPPKVPTLQFGQRRERPSWRWGTGSVLAHVLIIVALVVDWSPSKMVDVDLRTPGDDGPLGGGGGGGAERIHYVDMAWDFPEPEQTQEQRPEDLIFPTPEVVPVTVEIEQPRFQVPRVEVQEQAATVLGHGSGTAGGPGAGTGTGGGVGSGTGTGMGSHTGPGTGGEGGDIFPPVPRFASFELNSPKSVKGKTYQFLFTVGTDGRAESVEVIPEIRDAEFRRKLISRLLEWTFAPALTRDGRPIRVQFPVTMTL
jgi:hypothetical protein